MDQIEIAIGTYENLILGYRIDKKGLDESEGFTLESSFTTDSHCGALRCLSVSPQGVLVSSSTDDSMRLHSLRKRREIGALFQHDGSVNCIRFFKGGHMFSASEDGTICLWKCKNWELLRTLKGHHGCHVKAVTVHPSGKLCLSIGSDRTFFTWDMTTGKLAFKRKLDEVAEDLLFTHDGNHYVMIYQKKMEVCSLEDTEVVREIEFESRINDVCFIEGNTLAVGGDDGAVTIIDIMSNTRLAHKTFQGRVRSLRVLVTKIGTLLFVAGSSGSIRVCKLCLTEDDDKFEPLIDYSSGTRLTCMAVYASPDILKPEQAGDDDLGASKDVKSKKKKNASKVKEEDISLKEEDGSDDEEEDDDDVDSNAEEEDDVDSDAEEDDVDSDAEEEDDVDSDAEEEDDVDSDAEEESSDEESPEEEEDVTPQKKKRRVSVSPSEAKKRRKEIESKIPVKKQKAERKSRSKIPASKSKVLPPAKRRKVT